MKQESTKQKSAVGARFATALLAFAIVAVAVCAVSTARFGRTVGAEPVLRESYFLGEEVTVPDKTLSDGTTDYKAQKTVFTPDGRAFSLGKFTPDVMGLYKVEYAALTSAGKYLTETEEFRVYLPAFEIDGAGASAEWKAHEYTPLYQGLNVSLPDGSTLRYNGIVDLKALQADEEPLIDFYVTPRVLGDMDANTIVLLLTDAHNEDNYIKIQIKSSLEGISHGVTYISAGAAFQPSTGLEYGTKIHRDNAWGFPKEFSFYGTDRQGNRDESIVFENRLRLYFDCEQRQLLCDPNSRGENMVIDFDDGKYFADLWEGFSTDEVVISLYAQNYIQNTMNFVIERIGGIVPSSDKLIDDEAPTIAVDREGYETLPEAVVGKPYRIFDSTAYDRYSGAVPTRVNVYEDYGSSTQSESDVTDGAFVPTHVGKYSVVYGAEDYFGNTRTVVDEIVCKATGTPIDLQLAEDGRKTAFVGERVAVSTATATGGNGRVDIAISATGPDGDVAVENGVFKPLVEGVWHVVYTASDFVRQTQTASYDVQVALGDVPVFDNEPVFPAYFLCGYEYTLPEAIAFDYRSGGAKAAVTVAVEDDAGTVALGADRVYSPTVSGTAREVTVVYTATGAHGTQTASYTVRAINPTKKDSGGKDRLDMAKYFDCTAGMTSSADDDRVMLRRTDATEASATFVNELLAEGLNVTFAIPAASETIGTVDFVLTDKKGSVRFSLVKKGTEARLAINGLEVGDTEGTYVGGEFNLTYADGKVSIDDTTRIRVGAYENGELFEGFVGGKAFLTVSFDGGAGEGIDLTNLNLNRLNNAITDRVSPKVIVTGAHGGLVEFGKTFKVCEGIAADVFAPDVTATVRVVGPDNKPVVSTDGVLLAGVAADRSYEVEAAAYGTYRVMYATSEDAGGRTGAFQYTVTCNDTVAPTIALNGANVTTAKVGDVIVAVTCTPTDNQTASEAIIVAMYVILPGGKLEHMPGNSFVATAEGVWTIRYLAIDEAGNFTLVDNTIVVTG